MTPVTSLHYWFKSFIGKGLRLQPAQQACLLASAFWEAI